MGTDGRSPATEVMPVAGGEDVPRLSAVVERQQRELARARATADAAVVVATARGVLMERHGLSTAQAARQLADMAAAAGLPQPELAAAVLAEEVPAKPAQPQQDTPPDDTVLDGTVLDDTALDGTVLDGTALDGTVLDDTVLDGTVLDDTALDGTAPREPAAADTSRARPPVSGAALAPPGEWIEPGTLLGPADNVLAMAAAERAKDGAELVGALAAQLRIRFGATAAAVWLLDADGALELYGEDGLGGTEASRWRRLPPQFDCQEQRVAVTGADLWWPAGLPAADPAPAAAPWGRGAARALIGLRARSGSLLGVAEAWWPTRRGVFDASTRAGVSAVLAGFTEVLALRLSYAPVGSTVLSPGIWVALDELCESALVVRPLRDAAGAVTDFQVVYLSPGYVDPAGRRRAELAGLTLLAAYPASTCGDGLFAMAERVLASGHAEHVPPGTVSTLTGDADAVQVAGVRAAPFFAGVAFTWRPVGEAERLGGMLDHVQRLGRIGAWEEDLAAGAVHWTESAFALFGLDPRHAAAIPVASLHSFVMAADRALVKRFQQSLLHGREAAVVVFRIVRPGATAIRQIRVVAEPVLAGDEVVGLRGAFQDVSAHYHTQVALAATQDQLADSELRAEQEQQLALRLQRAIMPEDEPLLETAGVEVAVRYRPAEQGHLVAGDWYDALLLPAGNPPEGRPPVPPEGPPDGRSQAYRAGQELLLVVGDITGHGIDAVTGMIAARNALRGLAATGAGPADLLRYLNYAACHLTEGIAGTVVCGRYDPETRALRWARAGHLPPILVRDGTAEMLPLPGGIMLGLDPDAEYEEATLQMRSADTLLLFTDGLIERRAGSITDALRDLAAAALPFTPAAPSAHVQSAAAPGTAGQGTGGQGTAGQGTGQQATDVSTTADRILGSTISDTGDDACLVVIRIL
jgi:serine phosphatase RsbU (regulator of sigma subunit)/PAS domain-containing protein